MNIYLVTSGEYSDYRIRAAFSAQELADAYCRESSDASVEVWALDEKAGTTRKECYFASVYLDDGSLRSAGTDTSSCLVRPGDRLPYRQVCSTWRPPLRQYVVVWSSESPEHAMKACVEARQEWLRGNKEPLPLWDRLD